MKVYIIMGETGEYSDSMTWMTKTIYTSEKRAEEVLKEYQERADEIYEKRKEKWWIEDNEEHPDKDFQMDYTGTFYQIDEAWTEDE